MDELFDFFNGIRSKKLDIVKKLTAQRRGYVVMNNKLAEKNPEDIRKLTEMVLSGKLVVSGIKLLESEKALIADELAIISEAKADISKLEKEGKESAFNESIKAYWDSKYVDIILEVIGDSKYAINDVLANEAQALINEFREKTKGVKENCDTQKALFDKYDVTYCMYMGGVTDDDTRI